MVLSWWATALLVFLAVALGTASVALLLEWVQERRRARNVLRHLEAFAAERDQAAGTQGLFRPDERKSGALVEHAIDALPQLGDLRHLMRQGGISWSVEVYILITLGLAASFAFAAYLVFKLSLAAFLAAVLGGSLPWLHVRRRADQRLRRFEEQLPDSIDLIARAIRAGHPLSSGLRMVGEEAGEPVAGEFRRVFEEQRFGLAFEDSMLALTDRVPIVDVRILVTAILIQREVGGNLAEVLDNLSYTIRERFKIRRQLRVITAQGRLSGYILAALPIVVGFVIFLLNRPFMMTLFVEPVGRLMLVSAVVLQIIGYLWIRKIVNIEI